MVTGQIGRLPAMSGNPFSVTIVMASNPMSVAIITLDPFTLFVVMAFNPDLTGARRMRAYIDGRER